MAGVVGAGVCSGDGCRIGAGFINPMSVVHLRHRSIVSMIGIDTSSE